MKRPQYDFEKLEVCQHAMEFAELNANPHSGPTLRSRAATAASVLGLLALGLASVYAEPMAGSGGAAAAHPPTQASSDPALGQAAETHPYVSPAPRVGFAVPEGFRAVATPLEEGAEVIVVERGAQAGFQVFRAPHDEPALTPERIRLDLPDLVMERVQALDLGGAEALAFRSADADLGPTYEVWCVHGGYLYQVMARADFEAELNGILKSWRFID